MGVCSESKVAILIPFRTNKTELSICSIFNPAENAETLSALISTPGIDKIVSLSCAETFSTEQMQKKRNATRAAIYLKKYGYTIDEIQPKLELPLLLTRKH